MSRAPRRDAALRRGCVCGSDAAPRRHSFWTEDGIDIWTLDDLHEFLRTNQLWP
ncbi:MAG: hypothetical protein OXG52_04155 [bacterium]|nr:hypothetical protein [bacterium]